MSLASVALFLNNRRTNESFQKYRKSIMLNINISTQVMNDRFNQPQ